MIIPAMDDPQPSEPSRVRTRTSATVWLLKVSMLWMSRSRVVMFSRLKNDDVAQGIALVHIGNRFVDPL